MRPLNYHHKIILYNLLIYTITIAGAVFFAVQFTWFNSIRAIQNDLLQSGLDTNLYIQQQTASLKTNDEKAAYLNANASELYTSIVPFSRCHTELLALDGTVLAFNGGFEEPMHLTAEYEKCRDTGEPNFSVRNDNGLTELWMVTPILSKDNTVIGYTGYIFSLATALGIEHYLFSVLVITGVIGLGVLWICVSKFSNGFLRPIKDLTRISAEVNKGNYNMVIQYKKDDEIGDLTAVYNTMTQNINNVIMQLKSERQRLGSVLASLDDGLIALDRDGNIIASNSYLKTYFNVSNPKSVYDFRYQSFLRDIFDSLKQGQDFISEEVDCNGLQLLLTGSPIREPNVEENYMIIIRNVTATKTFEREQQKFISSVSHELRTPLTTIIGYTDMLKRRNVQDPQLLGSSLDTINHEGHRLVRLVDDLLSANSTQATEFTVRLTNVDLDALLRGVVDQMRIKCWQKEIEISYKAERNLKDVLGDYDRLSQIFINIIHNAMKYSEPGGIIDVVLTEENNQYLSVSIRDFGVGIDPAKKDFIFSAFYRVDEDRSRSNGEGGAGLGLYLVKQVVEKHNGKIRVDSEVGEGTNITVLLPVVDEPEDAHEA